MSQVVNLHGTLGLIYNILSDKFCPNSLTKKVDMFFINHREELNKISQHLPIVLEHSVLAYNSRLQNKGGHLEGLTDVNKGAAKLTQQKAVTVNWDVAKYAQDGFFLWVDHC